MSSRALHWTCAAPVRAQQIGPLPDIQRGDIAIHLQAIATGMGAPDYAISPPGDTSRLFVVEQNGLLRIIQNGSLLPRPALDIRTRVAPPLIPPTPTTSAGSSGWRFTPASTTPAAPATARSTPTPASRSRPERRRPMPAPNGATQNYKNVDQRMEDERGRPERRRSRVAPRDHLVRQERQQPQRRHDRVRPRRLPVSRHSATAATPTTSARATSSPAATPRT